MSHQPFENWILENDTLPVEDRRSLQAHIDGCQQCERMYRKWQAVQREMNARKMVAPAPGFAQRFQVGLAERRARHMRQQAWNAFLGFLGGALLILLVLVGYTLSISSPADWLAVIIRYGSFSLNLFDALLSTARVWLSSTPLALNVALWIYVTITLCLLSITWMLVLWRTSSVGVFKK